MEFAAQIAGTSSTKSYEAARSLLGPRNQRLRACRSEEKLTVEISLTNIAGLARENNALK